MDTMMTSGQLALQMKLFDEKGMTPDRWQQILASGIFADLCDKDAVLDRTAIRAALKLGVAMPTDTFTLDVDYGRTLEDMVAFGRYDWTNSDITAKRFPLKGAGMGKVTVYAEARLFHFDRDISSEKVVEAMKAEGWEPALIEHLLAFGEKYPEEQRKYPIIGLGSVAQIGDFRYVPCLGRFGRGRNLRLRWWGRGWYGGCRFLAVRPVVKTGEQSSAA
ncbi:MAG: hypothetical protein NT019_00760 [Candidatus Adlerbacteria bacterium]|nr:hypothetical protein [Candidatus Adlerbacteria bacterium]